MISRLTDTGGIAREITPSDTAYIYGCKALWSNTGGTVSVQWGDEAPVSIVLPSGYALPVLSPFKVRSTGTTTSVLGFFESDY